MRLYVALFHVVSILAISGSTLGDDADDDCGHAHGGEVRNLPNTLFDSLYTCFAKLGGLDLQELKSISSYYVPHEQIVEYCERQDLIKSCLSTISTNASACHNISDTQHEELLFLEETLQTALSYSCVERGLLFAHLIFGILHEENSTLERNAMRDCIDTPVEVVATDFQRIYNGVKTYKHCLVDRLHGITMRSGFIAELMLNRILRTMKCHRPEDGTTVLCHTLDTEPLTDDKVCLFKSGEEDEAPRFAKLMDYAAQCLIVNVNHLDYHTLPNFTTLEEHRSFVSTYCQNKPLILNCLGDVSVSSKVCLNETNQRVVQTLVDFLEHTMETACKADGVDLATIFNGIFNHKEGAVSNETLHDCSQRADDLKKSGSSSSANHGIGFGIVRAYNVADTLMQCILDGASEEGNFKGVFGTFKNEILTDAKCVNPEDQTVVPCATLVHT